MSQSTGTDWPETDPGGSPTAGQFPRRTALGRALAWLSVGFLAAGVFHLYGLLVPIEGSETPAWRHALFVAINAVVVSGLIFRWRGFLAAYGLLTVQQVYGHGVARLLGDGLRVQDPIVVFGMPLVLVLLVLDRRHEDDTPSVD